VVTETGAGCTSGACSPVQNTAFPGRAYIAGRAGPRGRVRQRPGAPASSWNCSLPRTGTAGSIAKLQGPGGEAKCSNCCTVMASYLELQGIDSPGDYCAGTEILGEQSQGRQTGACARYSIQYRALEGRVKAGRGMSARAEYFSLLPEV
jgi:hypothetical protein